jgi:branched-subunit amino acid aminotransferase/4-amino-4-deoxychorismate lyase
MRQVLHANPALTAGYLRISVSRGVGSTGYLPTATASTLVVEFLPSSPAANTVTLCTSQWQKIMPSQLPTHAKLAQGMQSTLAMMEAHEKAYDSALMLTPSGMISECANANLFWWKDGVAFTPALSSGCVAGVTRARLIILSDAPVQEVEAPLNTLLKADEVALSNSRYGLIPVRSLNDHSFTATAKHCHALAIKMKEDKLRHTEAHRQQWVR